MGYQLHSFFFIITYLSSPKKFASIALKKIVVKGVKLMAWNWNTAPVGTVKGTSSESTPAKKKTLSVRGISGNAILNTPETTVATINEVLGIGGKSIIVDSELMYNHDNEVVNNE